MPPPSQALPAKSPLQVLEEAERQWLFTEDELLRSPSVCDGMGPEEERVLRSKGVNFITQVGIMLKLSHSTLGTAAVFFNRFLMRRSLVDKDGVKALHHYQVAAVSVFLATKVEEHVRKVKELVVACCRIAQKNPNLLVDEQTKDFWRWRDSILYNEDQLLEWLCFDLTVESPYKILYELVKHYAAAERSKRARDTAWGFINDSHLTQMCLLFPSKVIACAALYAGCKVAGVRLDDAPDGQPWWARQRVRLADVRAAVNYMAEWYSRAQPLKPSQAEEVYRGLMTPEHGAAAAADDEDDGMRNATRAPHRPAASPVRSPATSASLEGMARSDSQQSLKRAREEDDAGLVDEEEAEKVHRSDEENERRRLAAAEDGSGLAPGGGGASRANGSATQQPPWARAKGEPAAKRAKVEAQNVPLRPPENGNGNGIGDESSSTAKAHDDGDDDDAEEGEVDE